MLAVPKYASVQNRGSILGHSLLGILSQDFSYLALDALAPTGYSVLNTVPHTHCLSIVPAMLSPTDADVFSDSQMPGKCPWNWATDNSAPGLHIVLTATPLIIMPNQNFELLSLSTRIPGASS